MARADRIFTLTLVIALVCACAVVTYAAMRVLEDTPISLIVGGLLVVSILSLYRTLPADTARSRVRAGRPRG